MSKGIVILNILAFVILFISNTLVIANETTLEPDTDRAGMDYKNFQLSESNPELCRAECDKDTNCRAYSYVKPGIQGSQAHCWLKSGVPNATSNQCCVSGVKLSSQSQSSKTTLEPDTDRAGMDYKNFQLSESNPELCRAECDKDTNCRAYSYNKPGISGPQAHCWLKSGVPNATSNQCCVSGVKIVSNEDTSDSSIIKSYLNALPQLITVEANSGTLSPIPNLPDGVTGTQRTGGQFVNREAELAILKTFPDIVWPGALVQGGTISDSNFAPINLPRAKGRIRLATNFVNAASSQKYLDLPTIQAGEVEKAIYEMLKEINATDSVGTLNMDVASAGTMREAMVKLGVAYKAGSTSASLDAKLNSEYNENTLIAKFTQVFYTASFDPDPTAESEFFASGVKLSDIKNYTSQENPPLYVSDVKYGRVLLFQFTSKMSKLDMEAAIKAAYNGFSGSIDSYFKEKINKMRINVLAIGSTGEVALDPLLVNSTEESFNALKSYITKGIKYNPVSNPGAPIAFTMRYVGSQSSTSGPHALAIAQMVTDESPEVVSLNAQKICHSNFKVWDGPGGGAVKTGINVLPGDKVEIYGSGKNWSGVFATGDHGPTGWYDWCHPGHEPHPISNRSPFSLIAKFGAKSEIGKDARGGCQDTNGYNGESSWFYVGNSTEIVVGAASEPYKSYGEIVLGTNDFDPFNGDKNKKFDVEVCVTRKTYD